jgi:hypothetical protein
MPRRKVIGGVTLRRSVSGMKTSAMFSKNCVKVDRAS